MTKTIVLGEQQKNADKKPIEFFSLISLIDSNNVDVAVSSSKPHEWNYVELICKDYAPNLDLIFVYINPDIRSDGLLIIGRWNDGVVQ